MTRLAHGRSTHLQPREIAETMLRLYDEQPAEPSMRQLAAALGVASSAVYHHFDSREAIVVAAVDLVWDDVGRELAALVGDPLVLEPREALVATGIATRRVFCRHFRIARYVAATPQGPRLRARLLGYLGRQIARLGLEGDDAAACFHAYSSYALGAALFAAVRLAAHEQLAAVDAAGPQAPSPLPAGPPESVASMVEMMD
ncbi:MAG TPA: TetR/AcrR family transcriptional regulator, partial [Capillimicrobium sp.]